MQSVRSEGLMTEVQRVLIHGRWPVQSYVVLGFLFGAVVTRHPLNFSYIVAFFAWLLIVVGLTVLNSYYDKDEAPVGGMQNPPKVNESLLYGALIMIVAGLALSFPFGWTFWLLAAAVVIVYFFYSYEGTRWKSNGYAAVGINALVGALTVLGAASLRGSLTAPEVIAATICAAAFKASVYSMMQVHQIEEDTARGDISFAVMHGRQNTLRFSQATMLIAGIAATAATYLVNIHIILPVLTALYFLGSVVFFEVWIRQNADVHQDSLRMQRMIYYTGYAGSVAFTVMYIIMALTGILG
jgi:4-hydroxybenzoate polyprenyltransferase